MTQLCPPRAIGHLTTPGYRAGNSPVGNAYAARHGMHWVDNDWQPGANTHWPRPNYEGFLPKSDTRRWLDLTPAEIAALRSPDGYRVRTMEQAFRDAKTYGQNVEAEAKFNCTAAQCRELAADARKVFGDAWKKRVWVKTLTDLPGGYEAALARLKAAKAAGFTTLLLLRGADRARRQFPSYVDYVRGATAVPIPPKENVTMTEFSRKDWGARAPKDAPTALVASRVEGVALHWPAMSKQVHGVEAVKRFLRNVQDSHMDDRGWDDVAYQLGFDQDGNTYDLRGLKTQSAANGDQDVNRRFGAFLLILAPGEQPSAKMIAAVKASVAEHRKLFPESKRIVGHQDVRPEPTACPGPIVEKLIKAGAFEPTKPAPPKPSGTIHITAFRTAKTRAEKRAAAKQILESGSARAKVAARDWLEHDTARAAAAKALLALEVK